MTPAEWLQSLIKRKARKAGVKKTAARKTAAKKTASRKTAHKKAPSPRTGTAGAKGRIAAPKPHTVAA